MDPISHQRHGIAAQMGNLFRHPAGEAVDGNLPISAAGES
jgi:hypothetical protein